MEYFANFTSATVAKIGYERSNASLEVEFHNGTVYQYFDVPEQIWEAFKASSSKGQFLNDIIKGQFRYSRV
ncbi:KTSC domain-containing protein [Longitalea luteola]|uniref:KTSC domain-containing protein n=1 Tax=Longitalea luteola TaxID=2812563 RepID=UPI001A979660|nr:KTSC domain-containing protein [Longitalea luteola]